MKVLESEAEIVANTLNIPLSADLKLRIDLIDNFRFIASSAGNPDWKTADMTALSADLTAFIGRIKIFIPDAPTRMNQIDRVTDELRDQAKDAGYAAWDTDPIRTIVSFLEQNKVNKELADGHIEPGTATIRHLNAVVKNTPNDLSDQDTAFNVTLLVGGETQSPTEEVQTVGVIGEYERLSGLNRQISQASQRIESQGRNIQTLWSTNHISPAKQKYYAALLSIGRHLQSPQRANISLVNTQIRVLQLTHINSDADLSNSYRAISQNDPVFAQYYQLMEGWDTIPATPGATRIHHPGLRELNEERTGLAEEFRNIAGYEYDDVPDIQRILDERVPLLANIRDFLTGSFRTQLGELIRTGRIINDPNVPVPTTLRNFLKLVNTTDLSDLPRLLDRYDRNLHYLFRISSMLLGRGGRIEGRVI